MRILERLKYEGTKRFFVLLLTIFAFLYGASYQQFNHFHTNDHRGIDDTVSYIALSEGNPNVSNLKKCRFVVPFLAGKVRQVLLNFMSNKNRAIRLSFYVVNFAFVSLAGLVFFYILEGLGFAMWCSLCGVMMFLGSRITVLVTGTPLVDSFYICSMSLIMYMTLKQRDGWLALLNPILIFSKELIIPFIFLPLAEKKFRNIKMVSSIIISIILYFGTRYFILKSIPSSGSSLLGIINILQTAKYNLLQIHLFTLKSLHKLQNGFSFFLIFAAVGFIINMKNHRYSFPSAFYFLLPLSVGYALMGGNLGRQLFEASYIIVFPHAIIFIDWIFSKCKQSDTCPQIS